VGLGSGTLGQGEQPDALRKPYNNRVLLGRPYINMTTSDAEDDLASRSASPDESADVEVDDMAEHPEHGNGRKEPNAPATNGPKANAKDPNRPRRKKARRACFACQRAHLTCGKHGPPSHPLRSPLESSGNRKIRRSSRSVLILFFNHVGDERPCQRCIKRGLQDACHDGVRKKAKYLHDAPNEALMPGVGGSHFSNISRARNGQILTVDGSLVDRAARVSPHNHYYPGRPAIPTSYAVYPPTQNPGLMGPPLQESMMSSTGFGSRLSPISPTFQAGHAPHTSPLQSLASAMQHAPPVTQAAAPGPYAGAFFDPSDPALFNFDLTSLNFGNHYGALEFGMLGHMSSGAADTPPSDTNTLMHQGSGVQGATNYATPATVSSSYNGSPPNPAPYVFRQDAAPTDWPGGQQPDSRHGSANNVYSIGGHMGPSVGGESQIHPNAFTIGTGPSSLTSPSPSSSPRVMIAGFDDGHTSTYASNAEFNQYNHELAAHQSLSPSKISTPHLLPQTLPRKRPKDPSSIYDSVKSPYSYTTGFHGLTAFLQRRFSPQKTLRIAKALASIRPSFISCTKTLNRDDLIFMEKCFQRTLWEYENFINACGTPTIVCRRTGEVAAVGKEFSILTGWKKDILLGKEANLNVNTGGTSGNPSTGTSSRGGFNTPRMPDGSRPDGSDGNLHPQPVFLAELLDDDSVIEFYEDFARLAFGDSRGSVTTSCKLLKYKTKNDASMNYDDNDTTRDPDTDNDFQTHNRVRGPSGNGNQKLNGKSDIAGEARMNRLGVRDGKVECSYCWTVKRDVFDIPMLIVMNVRNLPTLRYMSLYEFVSITNYYRHSFFHAFERFPFPVINHRHLNLLDQVYHVSPAGS